ncbi:MAG: hypothetical protein ACFB14_17820 [Leptolyngbyaceae cyanobacterium]
MKLLSQFLLLISLLTGIGLIQLLKLGDLKNVSNDLSAEEVTQQTQITSLRLELVKQMPRVGFRNMLANWVFLDFIQYFGDFAARDLTGYSLSPQFFDAIIDFDPRFFGAYLYLTNTVSIYAGQPQESVRLMEKGLNRISPKSPPNSYFVWRYKGTDEMLFLGDNQAAQQSFQTAADWAQKSPDEDAELTARLSQQTADFLATDPNSKPALINGWMSVLGRAIDDNVRQRAINEIEALGGEILFAENGQVTVRYNRNE